MIGSHTADSNSIRPLEGARICLVFEHSLAHYTRIRQEMEALQAAGATLELLTSHPRTEEGLQGVRRTFAPLSVIEQFPGSEHPVRLLRIASNLLRNTVRPAIMAYRRFRSADVRLAALKTLLARTDIMWVVDEPSLPSVMRAVRGTPVKVVYETVDLVPEYPYLGERHRRRRLREERRLIGHVDGFITACDSYADYYMLRYGGRELSRPPVVRNDMPATIAQKTNPVRRPLRILFLGALMYDRPVLELIEAMSLVTSDVVLTFQGENLLGSEPAESIERLGLSERVRILEPCPHDRIVEAAADHDVGIVALRGDNENERWASTTKLFTYMSAGLAVLGSDLPGIARIVKAYGNGRLVAGMDPRDWASAIDDIARLTDASIAEMKQRSLETAHTWAWEKQRPLYVAEFVRALGR